MNLICISNIVYFLRNNEIIKHEKEIVNYEESISKTLNIIVTLPFQKIFIKQHLFYNETNVGIFNNELLIYEQIEEFKLNFGPRLLIYNKRNLISVLEYFAKKEYVFLDFFKKNNLQLINQISSFHSVPRNVYFLDSNPIFTWIYLPDKLNYKENQVIFLNKTTKDIFEKSKKYWKADNLIHGDIKADNFLINESEIKLIDYELAGLGDPLWDYAFLLQILMYESIASKFNLFVINGLDYVFEELINIKLLLKNLPICWTDFEKDKFINYCSSIFILKWIELPIDLKETFIGTMINKFTVDFCNNNLKVKKIIFNEI